MNRTGVVLVCLLLLCSARLHAAPEQATDTNAIPRLLDSTDYSGLLKTLEKLSPEQKAVVETVCAGKAPTRNDAWRALARRAENEKWMADARTRMQVRGLYTLARNIHGFAEKGEPVWVAEVDMLTHFRQVFLIKATDARALALLP
jgi:hypothetical protein